MKNRYSNTPTPESDALKEKLDKFFPYLMLYFKAVMLSFIFFGGYLFCKIQG
jgi:hypothetical protein